VLALGTYLIAAELAEPQIAQAPSTIAVSLPSPQVTAPAAQTSAAATEASVPADNARQQQRRNAVLVNLASFRQ
jgi:hypothetical protein